MNNETFEFQSLIPSIKSDRSIIIAGPCSAESEEQVVQTAHKLSALGIPIFRAGIWKPRTRPNNFEGFGIKALPWLERAKQETGMYIATEIANVRHIEQALKHNIDILWIGARTTANPFIVQEIANELKGTDIPVMIKNPINPDLELWIGAIERIYNAGIHKIVAIHRGFSIFKNVTYRNVPHWQLVIELKRRITNLPIIIDPSHICGNRDDIQFISQKALDLNFDGLMIESHIYPNQALSDAQQQITPLQLKKILNNLIYRNSDICEEEIEDLRKQIDIFDEEIIDVFKKRMNIVEEIGIYKKSHNNTIFQSKRWNQLLNERLLKGQSINLSKEFIQKIFRAIHQESINIQTRVMNDSK